MKKALTRMLVLAAATITLSSLSFGSILCGSTPTTISAIIAGGGCSVGPTLFSNVSIATSNEGGGAPADAINPNTVELAFTGATSPPGVLNVVITDSDAAAWALTGSMQFDLILTYSVSGANPIFTTFGDSFSGNGTSNVNGTGAISFDKTANNQFLPTLSLAMMSAGPMNLTGAPISSFNVVDNVIVHATNASATLNSATNSFNTVSNTVVAPEPMTTMLLGSGLLAFGLFARRKRRS